MPPLTPLDVDYLDAHGFSAAANWLIPDRVMLGANPTKGRGSNLDRVMAIRCDAGCDTFVSLQEEHPEIDSTAPEWLYDPSNYHGDALAVSERPAQFVRHPIEDLRPAPSIEWLSAVVEDLAARVLCGEKIYIHCFAGRGRTGLIACCLLGRLYDGLGAEEALQRVGQYYALRARFGISASRAQDGMSPETEPQRQQVREYFASRGAPL